MILYFNPGHETAVNNASPYYTAPANVISMQQELGYLPAWYGQAEDTVIICDLLDKNYFSSLSENLNYIPKAITINQLPNYQNTKISLWGISPQSIHFFNELCKEYDISLDVPEWKEEYTYLNSRLAARDCLMELTGRIEEVSSDIVPKFYNNLEDIEKDVNNSDFQLLAKAPYSSSGRGLLWLPVAGLTRTERQILHGILKKQNCVSIERVLDKVLDFAMEFMTDGKGNITFAGYSLFNTNNKGAYLGNYIGGQDHIITQLTSYISSPLISNIQKQLAEILRDKYASVYKGCIGVDMLIYKENGGYKLHPCLEINMRYNMGYLALKLHENHLLPSSYGRFHLDFSAEEGNIFNKHNKLKDEFPASFENGRLKEGYLPLCPVNEKSKYWAYILIKS